MIKEWTFFTGEKINQMEEFRVVKLFYLFAQDERVSCMYLIQRANSSEEEGGLPIILINGGPGMPHNYLLPMKVIMKTMKVMMKTMKVIVKTMKVIMRIITVSYKIYSQIDADEQHIC